MFVCKIDNKSDNFKEGVFRYTKINDNEYGYHDTWEKDMIPTDKKDRNIWERLTDFMPVWVAVFGCISAVFVAFFGLLGTLGAGPVFSYLFPTQTPVTVATFVTDTPLPLTFTPVPPLPTVDATALPCTFSNSCAFGEDWQHNCISSQWTIYPSATVPMDALGCYHQPIFDSITTKNDRLIIFAQPKNMISTKEFGIFALLPQDVTSVRVDVDLDKLDNGYIWFGVFEKPATIGVDGLVIVAPFGERNTIAEQSFAAKDMSAPKDRPANSEYYKDALGEYSIGFDFTSGTMTAVTEGDSLKMLPFSSSSRWLFIGYRANIDLKKGSADIQALFSNLVIK